MFERPLRSALDHHSDRNEAAGLAARMLEVTDRTMIDVRGLASDGKFMAAVKDVLGFAMPTTPRTSVSGNDLTALWLSVDQWLITAERRRGIALVTKLQEKLQDVHSLIADVSDARTIIRLEGDHVREILNKGTSVDFTSGEYVAGSVRRLLFAQVAALAHVISDRPDVIDLYVFRSYADYAWRYLLAAAKEGARIKLFGKQPATRG
jgi:sarcosine oxidase subunit gamma